MQQDQESVPSARVGDRVRVQRSTDPEPGLGVITSVDLGRNMLTVRVDGDARDIRVSTEQVAVVR
jgi:hypothetical protein